MITKASESSPATLVVAAPGGARTIVGTFGRGRAPYVADMSSDGRKVLVAWTPDGANAGQDYNLVDLHRGTSTRHHLAESKQMRFLDPSGNYLVAARERKAPVRATATGRVLNTLNSAGKTSWVNQLLPTMDGRRILAPTSTGQMVMLDASTGAVQRRFSVPRGYTWCLARNHVDRTTFAAQCGKSSGASDVFTFSHSASTGTDRTSRVPRQAGSDAFVGFWNTRAGTVLTADLPHCSSRWVGRSVSRKVTTFPWWQQGDDPIAGPVAERLWVQEEMGPHCTYGVKRVVNRHLVTGKAVVVLDERRDRTKVVGLTAVADPLT